MSKKAKMLRDKADELRAYGDDFHRDDCKDYLKFIAKVADELAEQWDILEHQQLAQRIARSG
jgi:hypothetical protein